MSTDSRPSCFHCINYRLCSLRHSLDKVKNEHLFMLNTETGEVPNCVYPFAEIAVCCKEFKTAAK